MVLRHLSSAYFKQSAGRACSVYCWLLYWIRRRLVLLRKCAFVVCSALVLLRFLGSVQLLSSEIRGQKDHDQQFGDFFKFEIRWNWRILRLY